MSRHAMLTVVHDRAEDGAPDLCKEHSARRDLEVLAHLQVSREVDRRRDDVVTPHRELREGR